MAITRASLGALAALGLAAPLAWAPGAVRADAPARITACDFPLTEAIYQKWAAAGGQTGRLGCPSEKEIPISRTPTGATGMQANFAGGASILWHASGGHAGQTYTVQGCFYRLYAQYGGASGWLGLPVGDALNNPDGQTQAFEGGTLSYERATRNCTASHETAAAAATPAAEASAGPGERAPLDLWFDATRQEYFTSAQGLGAEEHPERYQKLRTEGYVFSQRAPGMVQLRAFWNEQRGDHLTVGTAEGERAAMTSGYDFAGGQGYVWSDPHPGARALKLYWSVERQDFLLAASPESEADAKAGGYDFVRIEGYAPEAAQ